MSTAKLISEMVPLGLAAAISPTLLSVAVLILSSKARPKVRTLAYLVGAAVSITIIFLIVLGGGSAAAGPKPAHPSPISAALDILLGALLLFAGARQVLKAKAAPGQEQKERVTSEPGPLGPVLARETGLGVVMTVTNFTSIVFVVTAAKETADSGVDPAGRLLAMTTVVALYLLPIILPLAVTLISPAASDRALDALNRALKKYGKYLIAAIALAFGVYLFVKGGRVLL